MKIKKNSGAIELSEMVVKVQLGEKIARIRPCNLKIVPYRIPDALLGKRECEEVVARILILSKCADKWMGVTKVAVVRQAQEDLLLKERYRKANKRPKWWTGRFIFLSLVTLGIYFVYRIFIDREVKRPFQSVFPNTIVDLQGVEMIDMAIRSLLRDGWIEWKRMEGKSYLCPTQRLILQIFQSQVVSRTERP